MKELLSFSQRNLGPQIQDVICNPTCKLRSHLRKRMRLCPTNMKVPWPTARKLTCSYGQISCAHANTYAISTCNYICAQKFHAHKHLHGDSPCISRMHMESSCALFTRKTAKKRWDKKKWGRKFSRTYER